MTLVTDVVGFASTVRGIASKSFQAESHAFSVMHRLLGGEAIVSPAGSAPSFPDFMIRTCPTATRTIDVHVEFKSTAAAQMGSMRDWTFSNGAFNTPNPNDPDKALLIGIMNKTPAALAGARTVLSELQEHVDPGIDMLYSGCLRIIPDQVERKRRLAMYAKRASSYQIAKISGEEHGLERAVKDHYCHKFYQNLHTGSDGSVLLMMLKDEVWLVANAGDVTAHDVGVIASKIGVDQICWLGDLATRLEVRIQPRGLNGSSASKIDVMASFRLLTPPLNGASVSLTS